MCSAVIIDGGLCSIECRQKQGFPRNNLKLSLYGINNKRSSDTVEKWLYWILVSRKTFFFHVYLSTKGYFNKESQANAGKTRIEVGCTLQNKAIQSKGK